MQPEILFSRYGTMTIIGHRAKRTRFASVLLVPILLATMLAVIGDARAAEHFVASSAASVDCGSTNGGVRPGDSIVLAAGERGPLVIRNCTGSAAQPIVVRNDASGSGPTVIRRTSASTGGFVFTCRDCVHVVIDGTGRWSGAPQGAYCGAPEGRNGCGIKVTSVAAGDAPSTYLMLDGLTTKVTIRGIEIDGRMSTLNTGGVGIQQNDHSRRAADHPGFWREDIIYENNYIHDVFGEGMYIGPNWPDGGIPLRNITIRNNLVEDTGRQNIQLKSALQGTNSIHDNVVRRSGLRGEEGQGAGISVFEGGRNTWIFGNWVEGAGIQGIHHYNMYTPSDQGLFTSEIFNNVIYDSGRRYGAVNEGHGISVGSRVGVASIRPNVYNNTIVKAAENGINFNSEVRQGIARDNIVADTASAALSLGNNQAVNNRTGTSTSMRFVDPGRLNFRLSADSPARNSGGTSGFPANDFIGLSRPQEGRADQGAFEFSSAAVPQSPGLIIE